MFDMLAQGYRQLEAVYDITTENLLLTLWSLVVVVGKHC